MNIYFYNTSSESNRLEKVLENETILSGNLKNNFDLINPVTQVTANILNFNYCYIPFLKRYYFIDKVEIARTNLYTIYLKLDVLQTYKEQIKELKVVLSGSSSNPYYKNYIDGVDVRTDYETHMFENNFDENGEIILVALYGKERVSS